MRFSSWLFNYSTPDGRKKLADDLAYFMEFIELNSGFIPRYVFDTAYKSYIHLMWVRFVLSHERELQKRASSEDVGEVEPEHVIHMDCNKLRVVSDKKLCVLMNLYMDRGVVFRDLSKEWWKSGNYFLARLCKAERIRYEQAFIKLQRERARRVRVYNL